MSAERPEAPTPGPVARVRWDRLAGVLLVALAVVLTVTLPLPVTTVWPMTALLALTGTGASLLTRGGPR